MTGGIPVDIEFANHDEAGTLEVTHVTPKGLTALPDYWELTVRRIDGHRVSRIRLDAESASALLGTLTEAGEP